MSRGGRRKARDPWTGYLDHRVEVRTAGPTDPARRPAWPCGSSEISAAEKGL